MPIAQTRRFVARTDTVDLCIDARQLTKWYSRPVKEPGLRGSLKAFIGSRRERIDAVTDLTFSVELGETVGLIGENGAGKSTTMKMLTGIFLPAAGDLRVLGYRPWTERRKLARSIGVVFGQRPQLLWDIPVRETFDLLRIMYRVPRATCDESYAMSEQLLDLEPLLRVPVRQLSLGQRMRCDLAAAFLHAPRAVFLDEPTIGLDLVAKEQARELIKQMHARFGTTVLITTHDLKDITETCRRVVLMDRGALLFDGSLQQLERQFASQHRLLVDLESRPDDETIASFTSDAKLAGGDVTLWQGKRLELTYQDKRAGKSLTELLLARLQVLDLSFEKPELEAIVRQLYAHRSSKEAR